MAEIVLVKASDPKIKELLDYLGVNKSWREVTIIIRSGEYVEIEELRYAIKPDVSNEHSGM